MPDVHNQKAFHAGEWAPNLYARVDLAKYHSAAALLRNFFVDYRGGASTRFGTKYCLQAFKSATPVRIIPFTASFTVSYELEFGDFYIRFYNNGGPVLETGFAVTGSASLNPFRLGAAGNNFSTGDWVFVQGIAIPGPTQVNGRYFSVANIGAGVIQLFDLNGVAIDGTAFAAWTAGGTVRRVYTLPSPYAAEDLALVKFAQNINTLILCHPSYPPTKLTLISATNWTIQPILFGSTVLAPAGISVSTTLGVGTVHYSYTVTAVDPNGQESAQGTPFSLDLKLDITTTAGTNTATWSAVPGAVSYNIYEAQRSYTGTIPGGVSYGFLGTSTGLTFNDTNISPNFSETPPITENPFLGAPVASVTVTAPGAYTTVPFATIAAPASGHQATASVTLQAQAVTVPAPTPNGFNVGEVMTVNGAVGGLTCVVATVDGTGKILTLQPMTFPGSNRGAVTSGATPANPVVFQGTLSGFFASLDVAWGVGIVTVVSGGDGYTAVPAVTFSAGAATATAVLGTASAGNPSVPAFFQQRLVLAAPTGAPQTFYMSQPGSYYNFNISDPTQPDDAITGTIVSNQLNEIKSMISMPGGLVMLSSRQAWQVSGGGQGSPITPTTATSQSQAYNGASDVPPIVANYDILYVQSKGSIVRDLSYNFYTNIYTGTDISILSSHLFYGFQISEWAFAEEPFKIVWAVRNDGTLLSLTFLKEQEVVGWAHSDTDGLFKSVSTITETISTGAVDAVYVVVERVINGFAVKYIERMADRVMPYGVEDAWCVDAAVESQGVTFSPAITMTASQSQVGVGVIFRSSVPVFSMANIGNVLRMGGGIATITAFTSTSQVTATITQAITAIVPGSPTDEPQVAAGGTWAIWIPATTFSGLDHLEGQTVTGVADGRVVPPTLVVNGSITLATPASKVILGLAYTPQLQTLILDLGEPSVVGKLKKIIGVTVRCAETLGIWFGRTLSTLVPMKDFSGTISSQGVTLTNALVTEDARQPIDPLWDQDGQYYITQPNPLPATILGVVPEIKNEDRK